MSEDQEFKKALVLAERESSTALALYGEDREIQVLAAACKKVAPWAKGMKPDDIGLVVRRAMSLGVDPLNHHEVQIWIDHRDQVNFQLSYTLMGEWVRHFKGDHTEPQYEVLSDVDMREQGIPSDAVAVRATFIMNDALDKFESLIKMGFDPKQARAMITTSGIGVGYSKEMASQYFAPAGRSKLWKIQKRALVDAYRMKFGTPTKAEIMELRRVSGRDQIKPEHWVMVHEYDESTPEEMAMVEAEADESKERVGQMSDEERAEVLEHGRNLLHDEEIEDAEFTEPVPNFTDEIERLINEIAPLLGEHEDHSVKANTLGSPGPFKIQTLWQHLGLGLPDWKTLTLSAVKDKIREVKGVEPKQGTDTASVPEDTGSGDREEPDGPSDGSAEEPYGEPAEADRQADEPTE